MLWVERWSLEPYQFARDAAIPSLLFEVNTLFAGVSIISI